jgi:L-fucose isomerase-like protein
MGDKNLCRTQAIIKLDGDVSNWLDNSLGNHQVIVYGNILEKLKVFCRLSDIELVL